MTISVLRNCLSTLHPQYLVSIILRATPEEEAPYSLVW